MKRNPDQVKIPCPCCGKPIYIDLKIFDRYRKAIAVINVADRHSENYLYPDKWKHPKMKAVLMDFYEQLGHNAPADTRRRTWQMYIIDLILSSATIRSCLKYFKLRMKSGG